jgi:hypothetical protein
MGNFCEKLKRESRNYGRFLEKRWIGGVSFLYEIVRFCPNLYAGGGERERVARGMRGLVGEV